MRIAHLNRYIRLLHLFQFYNMPRQTKNIFIPLWIISNYHPKILSEKGITLGQKKSLHNLFKNQFLVTRENLNGMVVIKLVLLQKLFNQLINK